MGKYLRRGSSSRQTWWPVSGQASSEVSQSPPFLWNFRDGQRFPNDKIVMLAVCISGLAVILALLPGRLLAMWPYAIGVEPEKGIWVYAPPAKSWVPIGEIVDIDMYSGMYGGGQVLQLNKAHGLVKQIYISSLFFSDPRIASKIRTMIDRKDKVAYPR
jgi:hypothetical protein